MLLKGRKNILEVHTALNDIRTEDRRNDGCDNLKDFLNSGPFNFHKVEFFKVTIYFAGLRPAGFFLLSLAQRKKQRNIHLTQALPYMERM